MIEKPSPNFGSRDGNTPKYICIHIMAGTLIGTDSWFSTPISQVSAHYGVGFTGEVHRYVDEKNSAWANGRVNNPTAKIVQDNLNINQNKISLSIEHEGQNLSLAPEAQINASANLIKEMALRWGIPIDRQHIIGHSEIYSLKPSCPSPNLAIIDTLIKKAQGITQPVDKEKIKTEIKRLVDLL